MSVSLAFNSFREHLDDHNDRRERLIKASRDVTIASKKVIFLLHRLALDEPTDSIDDEQLPLQRAAETSRKKLREIQKIFAGLKDELQGDRFWRYQRQLSPGLQEYIEALSFAHYLQFRSLITYEQVRETLCDPDGTPYFPLSYQDYLLGLSDLTGELMRFAISGLTGRGGRAKALAVRAFVRNCKADFEQFTPHVRDLSKKQAITTQSLHKIEDAVYTIVLRGKEYDLSPEMIDDLVGQSVSRFSDDRDIDFDDRDMRINDNVFSS